MSPFFKDYATETYIMHFLEVARFLNAPVLSGCKVNVWGKDITRAIGRGGPWISRLFWGLKWQWAQRVAIWPQESPLCSRLHKITGWLYGAGRYDFDAGQRHYLGNWKGRALKISPVLGPNIRAQNMLDFQGPPLPIARVKSLPCIKIITARTI